MNIFVSTLVILCLAVACNTSTHTTVPPRSMEGIMEEFKRHNLDKVIEYCTLPFNMNTGTEDPGEQIITDKEVLKKKIKLLFDGAWTDKFLSVEPAVDSVENQLNYQIRSFNEAGELESESSLIFNFEEQGPSDFLLSGILMAG